MLINKLTGNRNGESILGKRVFWVSITSIIIKVLQLSGIFFIIPIHSLEAERIVQIYIPFCIGIQGFCVHELLLQILVRKFIRPLALL